MNDNKKIILLVIAILTFIILITGGTYSYWTWITANTERTNAIFTATQQYSCGADGGGNITSSQYKLAPTDCTDPEYAIQRTITTNVTNNVGNSVYLDLWLDINNIGTYLSQSENFNYAITSQANDCTTGVIKSGTFNEKTNGGYVMLLSSINNTTSNNNTYYLYIWLDEAETNNNTMNQVFDFSLNGRCSDILYGDVDGDGKVTNADYNILIRYYKYHVGDISSEEAADVNADGIIDATDGEMIAEHVKGRGSIILGPH